MDVMAIISPTSMREKSAEIAQRWMEMVLGEKMEDAFLAALQDGVKLCALANKLFKALGMKDQYCAVDTCPLVVASTDPALDDERKRNNLLEFRRCCLLLGVPANDCMMPEDLLGGGNVSRVYQTLRSLQSVAMSLSNRRSIDERFSLVSMDNTTFENDISSTLVFSHDEDMGSISRSASVVVAQASNWRNLLENYETLLRQKTDEKAHRQDGYTADGMGELAHAIWRMEEHIRCLLMKDDEQFGPIPDDLHGSLWMLASGAAFDPRMRSGYYHKLLEMELENEEAARQIDADLHRTIAESDKPLWSEEKSGMLRRILLAYANENPSLGYCQGLNYIVARMLLYLEEEQAFFLMCKLVKIVPHDYYTTMLGLAVDQHIFADLVRMQTPDIADHLTSLGGSGIELSLACTEWFLTMFSSPCPREVTLCVWDAIFLFGDEILFRVALALMQQERKHLLSCHTYGDMLKRLNEIGREDTDAFALILESREQDCVIPGRIDDFRAHHRLQLASGIAISSVEAEDTNNTDSYERDRQRHRSSKRKQDGNKKRHGLFKHYDMHAGRLCRTFERQLTDDYIATLRRDHPNFACLYDGKLPELLDDYWTARATSTMWAVIDERCYGSDGQEIDPNTGRYQSESCIYAARNPRGYSEIGLAPSDLQVAGKPRERRSKSTAFANHKKDNHGTSPFHPHRHQSRKHKNGDEESHVGRSPISWIQRLEEWHKDMKMQKEKRKAEKMRQKLGRQSEGYIASSQPSLNDRCSEHPRIRKSMSSSPKKKKPFGSNSRGLSFDSNRSDNGAACQHDNSVSSEIQFNSGTSIPSAGSLPTPAPRAMPPPPSKLDGMRHTPILPEDKITSSNESSIEWKESADTQPNGHLDDVKNVGEDVKIRNATSQHGIHFEKITDDLDVEQQPLVTHSYSTPCLTDLEDSQIPKHITRPAFSSLPPGNDSLNSELLFSPEVTRSQVLSFEDPLLDGATLSSLQPPCFRRNVSLPLSESSSRTHRPINHRRIGRVRAENVRMLRDRAHVVSFMQRKASDAGSLAGSGVRSPLNGDMVRLSGSSSGSSQPSDRALSTSRSGVYRADPTRKGSFSFFEKLSFDLGSCLDDLNSLQMEEKKAPPLLPPSSSACSGAATSTTAVSSSSASRHFSPDFRHPKLSPHVSDTKG